MKNSWLAAKLLFLLLLGFGIAGLIDSRLFQPAYASYLPTAPTTAQIQASSLIMCADTDATHTLDFTCTTSPTFSSFTGGTLILFRFSASQTTIGNPTLAVNSGVPDQIFYQDGTVPPAGALFGDQFSGQQIWYIMTYNVALKGHPNGWILQATSTIPVNGQKLFGGPSAPTVASCGSGAALEAGATNNAGTIDAGTGIGLVACTLNFGQNFINPPACTVADNSTAIAADISSVSVSQVVFGFSVSIASGKIYYHCF